ncbi:uncharacterized protein [Euwallacea similis]|uniref:uncharacterized protein n=1 Tax=Euwallacea similis TaxID=1736056 RepID=UPI00344FF43A
MAKVFICLSMLLVGSLAIPVKDELMFEGPDDTATVESTVREARAAPKHIGDLIKPGVKDAFLYTYGDAENDDGEFHGYSKTMNNKGQDGYLHRDKFHKKDGDKYAYEIHSEYGQENKAKIDNLNAEGIKKVLEEAKGASGEESRKEYSVFEDGENKKQPKKKVEAEFNYFGEDGDGGDSGGSYYGEGSSSEGEGEGGENAESSEGGEGGGDGEEKEEYSEESEEGDGEGGEEENDY